MKLDSDSFARTFNWKEGHFSFVILRAGFFNVTQCAIFYSYWKIYQTVKKSIGNVNANVAQNGVGIPRFHRADIKILKSFSPVICFFYSHWVL